MSHPFDLTGRTILVTGATAGIGRQTAISVSEMGARLVITGRNEERLADTFSRLRGDGHLAFSAELAAEEPRSAFVDKLPPLDGIAHCAGVTLLHPFKFSDERRFREVYAANVEAPLFVTQGLFKKKRLKSGSSIVFVSSISPKVGTKGHAIYSGSKAAVHGISRVLAHELASSKIRSNCVSPGMVQTEVAVGMANQISPELLAIDEARYPLGYGSPCDVANAIIFFLAPASKWITGVDLTMDGGLT
jgi:NAD(P)-dependent dehydrogenase (short-subunit alcohol dehydrogenase family)